MSDEFCDQKLVAVDKVGGLDFLSQAAEAWSAKDILIIGEYGATGLKVDHQVSIRGSWGWWQQDFLPDDSALLAQISNSSGTTGPPKAIAISRRAVSDTVQRLRQIHEINSSIREYVAVPSTFSFGLGRIRTIGAVGGEAYVSREFRPDELFNMVRNKKVNAFSAVPSMLRILLAHPDLVGDAGRAIRWLEIGSQHMSAAEKLRVRQMFPNAAILQHYGLTEASRTTFLRIDQANNDELESVGRPTGSVKVRVGDDHRISITGPHLASGTVSEGRLQPIANADGWLQTSDLGEIRRENIYFKGRMDDVANIGGVKVSAEHFERLLSQIVGEDVQVAASPLDDDLRGQLLGVFYEGVRSTDLRSAVANAGAQLGLGPADFRIIKVKKIPKTETGKVMRKQLVASIPMGADVPSTQSAPLKGMVQSPNVAKIAAVWQEILGVEHVRPQDTFHDLGGDSLSAVGILLRSEEVGLPPIAIQQMFDGMSVAEIAATIDNKDFQYKQTRSPVALRIDALNCVRGLFALLIVVSHWGPFFVVRMGEAGAIAWSFAAPLLRIGTPGFAMVFGMGLGLFYIDQIQFGRERLQKRLNKNSALLFSGVALTALAKAAEIYFTGDEFGEIWPERLFYTVLLFYAFAVPTSIFWLTIVMRANDRVFASLLLSLVAYSVHTALVTVWPVNLFSGWASLLWHMSVAPYSLPRLMGAVSLGLAASLWLQTKEGGQDAVHISARSGLILGGFGGLIVTLVPGGWTINAGQTWAVLFFAGVSFLIYAGAQILLTTGKAKLVIRIAIVCGVLAFPIFIGHGLVMPIAAVIESFGLNAILSAMIPASLFIAVMAWLGLKIYSVRFGNLASRKVIRLQPE